MRRDFNDSLTLDNGVAACVMEAWSSKRANSEIHPRAAPSFSVSSLRGGKTRGKDAVE